MQIYNPAQGSRHGIMCNNCGMQITWFVPEREVPRRWNDLPRKKRPTGMPHWIKTMKDAVPFAVERFIFRDLAGSETPSGRW